jgi:hypothetical protein
MTEKKLTTRENFIKDVINKMFEIAGHTITYDDIKDRKDDWYTQWTMTMEQEKQWKEWGVQEIRRIFKFNKYISEKEMQWISLMWGLKITDFKKATI